MVIDFIRGWNAFVIAGTQSIGGAEVYFDNISNPLFLAKNILYWFQTMLGDGVIVSPLLFPVIRRLLVFFRCGDAIWYMVRKYGPLSRQ